jgi:hypothetical protein
MAEPILLAACSAVFPDSSLPVRAFPLENLDATLRTVLHVLLYGGVACFAIVGWVLAHGHHR